MTTKPKGYWTYYPHVEQEALECGATNRTDLQTHNVSAYQAARINEWWGHLEETLKWADKVPNGHWLEYENHVKDIWECKAESLGAWGRHSPNAISLAYRYGFIPQLLLDFGWTVGESTGAPRRKMRKKRHVHGALKSKEYVLSVADQYDTWHDFITEDFSAYSAARHYGFVEYIRNNTTAEIGATPLKHWRNLGNCLACIDEHAVNSMQELREVSSSAYRGIIHWGHFETIYEIKGWERRKEDGHWNSYENIVADIEEHGDSSLQTFRKRNTTAYLKMQDQGFERHIIMRFNWTKSVGESLLATYLYWYVSGKRIYIGITVDPEGRDASHQESPYEVVKDLACAVEPAYFERLAQYNQVVSPYAMDRDHAMIMERRMIKCAAAKGYEVTNRVHNPQFSNGKYSWETA